MPVRRSGVCDPDLHTAMDAWPVKPTPSFMPGHEIVGEVAGVCPGHMAMQYPKAVGLHMVTVDIANGRLRLTRELGADLTLSAVDLDPVTELQPQKNCIHGSLVTAVSKGAFSQAGDMLRRGGHLSRVGLPAGDFPRPIFEIVSGRRPDRPADLAI
ncbi:MAG: zinc-binding dehydrogenase [Pseudomonadota bacterium]